MSFTIRDAHVYIASVTWKFARTMPQWPHEYTVRNWRYDLASEFFGFADLIRRVGAVKPWPESRPRYHHTYVALGDWEYWTMGEPIRETTVINRALLGEPIRLSARQTAIDVVVAQ